MAAETTGGRWFSTLLGGTVLAVAGFGAGMLAGGLWESPDLVFHYLLGNTEEGARVALEAPAGPGGTLSVPSPSPALETVAIEEPEEIAKQKSEGAAKPPALPPVAARPPSPPPAAPALRMAVQVGAFAESRSAEKLAAGLRAKGYSVYLSPGAASGDARWRVRVGPIASKEEADRTAKRLKAEEKLPTWVLREDS